MKKSELIKLIKEEISRIKYTKDLQKQIDKLIHKYTKNNNKRNSQQVSQAAIGLAIYQYLQKKFKKELPYF